MTFSPIALILAAGEASRFGSPKQLAELDGISLLERAVNNVRLSGCKNIYVITGAWRKQVEDLASKLPVITIHHEKWQRGQSASVNFGLEQMTQITGWSHLHLFPVDMPWYTSKYFTLANEVANKKASQNILVATLYPDSYQQSGPGLPLLLPRAFVEDHLSQLTKQSNLSLRKSIARYPYIETLTAGTHTKDVDRPADLY